jgi:hypothetical protein
MKFFIGAKNLTGQVIVAEIIEAKDFSGALNELQQRAYFAAGPGQFRLTAVNEQIAMSDARSGMRDQVATFLEL